MRRRAVVCMGLGLGMLLAACQTQPPKTSPMPTLSGPGTPPAMEIVGSSYNYEVSDYDELMDEFEKELLNLLNTINGSGME